MLLCVCTASAAAAPKSKWHSAVRVAAEGLVLEPASGTFDVSVAPGANVQAAVDRCPPGGCVLLLPGTHDGPLVLAADKVVHVFGRGLATLRTASGTVIKSESTKATLDGLVIRREAGGTCSNNRDCAWVKGGRLRLQGCDLTSEDERAPCAWIEDGADPLLLCCRYVRTALPL